MRFASPRSLISVLVFGLALTAAGCGGSAGDADRVGVAAECMTTAECGTYVRGDAGTQQLQCLPAFRGGYCAVPNCVTSTECPEGSVCVAHTDGSNYCLRSCDNKPECNANRSVANEANCSSSFNWAVPGEDDESKVCIPPSS